MAHFTIFLFKSNTENEDQVSSGVENNEKEPWVKARNSIITFLSQRNMVIIGSMVVEETTEIFLELCLIFLGSIPPNNPHSTKHHIRCICEAIDYYKA